jgi:O-antigen/teichoic acid export membrane protein
MTSNTQSLRQKIFKGTIWTMLGMGASQLFRFGKSLILTRLLFPEAYGLMAIVWTVTFGLVMLSDAGLSAAALRHKRGGEEDFLNTIWTMKIIRGVLFFMVMSIVAYPVSQFYLMPDLAWLIPIAGFAHMLEGFSSTNIYILQRNMVYGRLNILEFSNEVLGLVIILTWAYFYPSVAALIGSVVVCAFFQVYYSHALVPGNRNRLRWDSAVAKEVFHFGKWVLLSSCIYLIYSQGDRLMLGKHLTASQLGIYSIAIMLSEVISVIMAKINSNVVYPALSNVVNNDRERLPSVFYKMRLLTDGLLVLPSAVLMIIGAQLVSMLYDVRYREAGWILQILCVRLLMSSILTSSESCLLALGKPKYSVAQNSLRASVILVGIPLGWAYAGIHGVVWAVALTEVPVLVLLWFGMYKNNVFSIFHELRSALFAIIGIILGYCISNFLP